MHPSVSEGYSTHTSRAGSINPACTACGGRQKHSIHSLDTGYEPGVGVLRGPGSPAVPTPVAVRVLVR